MMQGKQNFGGGILAGGQDPDGETSWHMCVVADTHTVTGTDIRVSQETLRGESIWAKRLRVPGVPLIRQDELFCQRRY